MGLDQNIVVHGVRERTPYTSPADFVRENLRLRGFAVIRSSFAPRFIEEISTAIDSTYDAQCKLHGGEDNLVKISYAHIVRAPCSLDDRFIAVAMDPVLQEICELVLGPYWILQNQNAVINIPGTDHYQFTWHRDLNYQHWTSSRSLGLSALLCVDPFNEVTGGTYVLPGSQHSEAFPSDRYVLENQVVVCAAPGDWIVFDSMLFHRTGQNSSKITRRGINHIIVPPIIRQQYSFPNMLAGRLKSDAERRFFGVGQEPSPSANEWRQSRIDALNV